EAERIYLPPYNVFDPVRHFSPSDFSVQEKRNRISPQRHRGHRGEPKVSNHEWTRSQKEKTNRRLTQMYADFVSKVDDTKEIETCS
ncbi:MAG: hypothetical protein WAK31_27520, partial [Chthoniobacterales bacterium]